MLMWSDGNMCVSNSSNFLVVKFSNPARLNFPDKCSDSQDGMGEHIPQAAKSCLTNQSEIDTEVRKEVEHASRGLRATDVEAAGEVNMEASVTPEEVVRAGGFGARDDMSSVLPVASDSTDFEASLLDARDYEEPQGKISRPGLGWSEGTDQKLQP